MTTIEIPAPAGRAEAWLTGTQGPGVLLYVDAIGLRPQIRAMADRVAAWGFVVLAPHVFYREGRAGDLAPTEDLREPGHQEEFMATAMSRVRGYRAEQAEADAPAWVAALQDAAPGPIGVVGFCMGARLALRTAGLLPQAVAACAGFHGGGLVTDAPDSPHRRLPTARAELVLGHADHDRSMPPEAVKALGRAATEAGLVVTNEVYPGAPHGYTMTDTSAYDEDAAERAFATLRDLLTRTLLSPTARPPG